MVGEEQRADDVLADIAAAGDTGHGDGAENRHEQDLDIRSGVGKGNSEHTEEERDLQHAAEARAVHMHGRTQRDHKIGNIVRHAAVLRSFQVGGDRCNRGAGAKRRDRRTKDVFSHDAHALRPAAETRIERKGNERIGKAQRIIRDHRASVGRGDLRAVSCHERSEKAEKRNGGIVGNQRDDL